MADQVEIQFFWMSDCRINNCSRWNISIFPVFVFFFQWEEASVVTFLHYQERDIGLVFNTQAGASSSYSTHFLDQHLQQFHNWLLLHNLVSFIKTAKHLQRISNNKIQKIYVTNNLTVKMK